MSQQRSSKYNVEATYSEAIQRAVVNFGDHRDLTKAKVVSWLSQFSDVNRDTGAKALDEIKYFQLSDIESMTRQLFEIVNDQYSEFDRNRIFFVPVGGPGSGASVIARHLRIIGLPESRIVDLLALTRLNPADIEVIVFVDDFSGTGGKIKEWWYTNEQIVLPINARVVSGILLLNHKARNVLDELFEKVHFVNFLDESADVFSESSIAFNEEEKEQLFAACQETGVSERFVSGWGDCGLLLAYAHGCPNNSLPILWYESEKWESLFKRRSA